PPTSSLHSHSLSSLLSFNPTPTTDIYTLSLHDALPILFITIFAVAAAALPEDKRHALTELADAATQALIVIVRWVLLFAPLGILALVAGAGAALGVRLVVTMAMLIIAVIPGLAVFIAVVYGVNLGAVELVQAGAAVFLTSFTVASVPSASIVSLAPAFASTGLPFAGLQLLLGLDRIPDMFRTMTNVVGHLTGAVVV